jgi:enoyl-CoA hydratase/carnithine racemase
MAPSTMSTPPPTEYVELSFPAPKVLLVTLNRPKDLNCINSHGNMELDRVWKWLDAEDELTVAVLTGKGRAFCAGADLKGTSPSKSLLQRRALLGSICAEIQFQNYDRSATAACNPRAPPNRPAPDLDLTGNR